MVALELRQRCLDVPSAQSFIRNLISTPILQCHKPVLHFTMNSPSNVLHIVWRMKMSTPVSLTPDLINWGLESHFHKLCVQLRESVAPETCNCLGPVRIYASWQKLIHQHCPNCIREKTIKEEMIACLIRLSTQQTYLRLATLSHSIKEYNWYSNSKICSTSCWMYFIL